MFGHRLDVISVAFSDLIETDSVIAVCCWLPLHLFFFFNLDYVDKPLEKPLKLVLKVGGSEVTELSGSGHDSSYYDDRSDHERERHKEKKKKKKKKSEKEKEKHLDDEERRKRKVSCDF